MAGPERTPTANRQRQWYLSRQDMVWLGAIVALAFAARLVWVLYAEADPLDGRFNDSVFYHVVAAHMSEGGGYTNPFTFLPTAQWPPGYVFFLVPLYWLFGDSFHVAELAHAVLGALTVGVLYLLTLRLFEREAAGVAALLLAFLPGTVMFTSVIYSETLYTFIFTGALLLLVMATRASPATRWRWVAAFGLVAGYAAMVREAGLSLLIVAALVWLLRGCWRDAVGWTSIALVSAAVVVLPWTMRNVVTMDAPLLLSSSSGPNFWMGNNAYGDGSFYEPRELIDEYGPRTDTSAEVRINNAGWREGLRYAVTHPVRELQLAVWKVRHLYEDDLMAFDLNEDFERRTFMSSTVRGVLERVTNAYYFAVIASAGLAVIRWGLERRPGLLLPVVTIGVVTLGHLAFFTVPRFHLPLMPVFCALAGWGLAGLPAIAREMRARFAA